jgi:hypothetical protein
MFMGSSPSKFSVEGCVEIESSTEGIAIGRLRYVSRLK